MLDGAPDSYEQLEAEVKLVSDKRYKLGDEAAIRNADYYGLPVPAEKRRLYERRAREARGLLGITVLEQRALKNRL